MFADDVVVHLPGRPDPIRGRTAYADLVRRSYEVVKPVGFEFHEIAVQGDSVLAEWTITLELRQGGGTIEYRGMSTCELTGGLISTWREYYDPASLRPS